MTDQEFTGAGLAPPGAYVWDVAAGGAPPVARYLFSAKNFRRDVAFTSDSQRILVAGADGTALVDIASGQQVGEIAGAYPPIAVSPDGMTLAAATDEEQGLAIGLFDLASGERRATLAGHGERINRLLFSADGSTLASGADDQLVMVWDAASGQRRNVYRGHAAAINALAFSPDGTTLWSGGDDRAIFAWDLERADTLVHRASPAVPAESTLPFDSVDMIIAPGGRYVAYPFSPPDTEMTSFQVRDLATGALGPPAAEEDGLFMSFSPDGDRYVTISGAGTLRVWDTGTGALLADSEDGGRLFSMFPAGAKAVFTPDGRHVLALEFPADDPDLVGRVPETLVVLDATTLAPVGEPVELGYAGRMMSVTPDGTHAVVVANTVGEGVTQVLLVDLEARRVVRSTPVPEFDERSGRASEQHGGAGRSNRRHRRSAGPPRGRRRRDRRCGPGHPPSRRHCREHHVRARRGHLHHNGA